MKEYTYLLINFFAILIPFIFSFHPKIQFHKTWKAFFPSVILVAVLFLAGDVLYTYWEVWGFNPDYLTGVYLFNLPMEEVLFFFCIPYACTFTYHCISKLVPLNRAVSIDKFLTLPLIISLIVFSIFYIDKLYSFAAFGGLAIILSVVRFGFNVEWLGKFYVVYLILLFPFLIINGLLTGTALDQPVVWYDNNENIGFRVLTIPFEDTFYGMSLLLLNVFGFEYFKVRYGIE